MAEGISTKTRKRLWLRSGGRCAYAGCNELLVDAIDDLDDTVLGVECHIVSQNDDPQRVARSVSVLSLDERVDWANLVNVRHGFANLVLMCSKHSKIIDDPNGGYSVAAVVEMKRTHERAEAERRTGPPDAAQRAQMIYAEIIDDWETRIDLDNWNSWMGGVLSDGHPRMDTTDFDRLAEARDWLFSRVWPGTEADLEDAFDNFWHVAQDLQLVLMQYPNEVLAQRGVVAPTRFYNDPDWIDRIDNNALLIDMYEWYAFLLEDLALELARAANLVCTAVRKCVDPRYRLDEGLVVITSGPYGDLMFRRHRPQYGAVVGSRPYNGVRSFLEDRTNRDEHRGEGAVPRGLRLPGDSFLD